MVAGVKIALLALTAGAVLAGCGQFDEDATFTIRNDTAASVIVKQCGSNCTQFHEVNPLKAGQSVSEGAFVGGPPNDFLVVGVGGTPDRCLSVLISSTRADEIVVPVSSAKPCTAAQRASPDLWGRLFG